MNPAATAFRTVWAAVLTTCPPGAPPGASALERYPSTRRKLALPLVRRHSNPRCGHGCSHVEVSIPSRPSAVLTTEARQTTSSSRTTMRLRAMGDVDGLYTQGCTAAGSRSRYWHSAAAARHEVQV